MIEPDREQPKKKEWTEGNKFIKKITSREPLGDQHERVALECGHTFRVRRSMAEAYRCMFCVQDFTGSNTDYRWAA